MPAVSYQRFAAEVEEIYSLKGPATLCKMRQVLREFGELPGVRKTSDLRPVTVARWIGAHRDGRSPATLDSLLRSMKSACMIGVASGYMKATPFAVRIDVPEFDPAAAGKRRHHSTAEVSAVLALAAEEAAGCEWKAWRLEALVNLYAYAGLRKMEAIFLHKDDVDLSAGVLRVDPRRRRLKTRASAAAVPIAPPLAAVLRDWLPRTGSRWVVPNVSGTRPWDGGPVGHKALDQIKALGRRAGVSGLTILSFRHSFATHARSWGFSDLMLRAILRHTTVRTQRAYLHDDIPDFAEAIARVSYAASPPRAIG